MYYKGPLFLSAATGKALSGSSEAKTTDYGDSCEFILAFRVYHLISNAKLVVIFEFEVRN
jgi:hypothetical protein